MKLLRVGDREPAELVDVRARRAARRRRGASLRTVTARISGLSRAPWQAEQVRRLMYCRMRWRRELALRRVVEVLERRDEAVERLLDFRRACHFHPSSASTARSPVPKQSAV